MKKGRKYRNSLIMPILNGMLGLIMLLSIGIGVSGYLEFMTVLRDQYVHTANGIAEYVSLGIDVGTIDHYLETGTPDEDYEIIREHIQNTADAEECHVIYVAKVHADTNQREYIYNVVSQASGFSAYEIGYRDVVGEEFLEAYDSILRGEKDLHSFMYKGRSSIGSYTTSIVPIRYEDGTVAAVVGVVKSMSLLDSTRSEYITRVLLIELLLAVSCAIGWTFYMRHFIVLPVRQLSSAAESMVEHLTDGKAPEIVAKKDNEIKELADAFSQMYREVGSYIDKLESVTAEKERIGAELNVAAKIQSSMLPCIFPPFPNRTEFDLYATMDPAKEVGGDFYDFFMVDEDHLAFVVADVSGKGVPAALFMVIGKTLIKDHTGLHDDLGTVFTEVNRILCSSNSEEMFITAFEGVLNLKTGELRYVNAGHETPFICRKGGVYEPVKVKRCFVLAGMDGVQYRAGELKLEPGDRIFQYSDGVPEATNAKIEQYGMERLGCVLARNSEKTPADLLAEIKADMDEFVGDADQFDDITMFCLHYMGQ